MPYTPAQERMLHADAAGHGTKGPSASTAKKMLAEHATTRTDVDRTGHAKKTKKKKKVKKKARKIRKRELLLLAAPWPMLAFSNTTHAVPAAVAASAAGDPSNDLALPATLSGAVVAAAIRSATEHGLHPRRLAIADMSQPSTAQRLYIIDMDAKKVVLRTWVAHGQNSGDLTATKFSNRDDSHETSLGL